MKKYTNTIAIAAVAGFFLIFNFVIWKGFVAKKTSVRRKIGELDKKIELVEKIGSAQKEFDFFSGDLFNDFFAFKQAIEKNALEQGVTVRSVKPFSMAHDESFPEIKVNLEIDCAYHDLVAFFAVLEKNPLVGIERVVVIPKTEDAESLNVSLTLIGFGK